MPPPRMLGIYSILIYHLVRNKNNMLLFYVLQVIFIIKIKSMNHKACAVHTYHKNIFITLCHLSSI